MSRAASNVPVRRLACRLCGYRWETGEEEPPRGCPRCGRVNINWRNFQEVIDWLMRFDPDYRASYTQGA